MMKKLLLSVVACLALFPMAFAGSDYDKNVVVKETETGFYADTEVTIDAFGAYVFKRNTQKSQFGGGMDVKYFMNRNIGLGIEAFGLNGNRDLDGNRKVTGAVLGTLTLRYPIGASRFAPYAFGGGGSTFNGDTHLMGQVGGGLEVRMSPKVGVFADVSENFIKDSDNSTMARAGINLAF